MSSEETISDDRVKRRVEEVEGRDLGVSLNIFEREDEREECFNLEEEIVCEVGGEERESLFGSGGPLDAPVFPLPSGWVAVPHPKPIGVVVDGIWFRVNVAHPQHCESGKEKGWYYITGRVVNKKRRGLFNAGPSFIKGWKDKFFFADDTEWDKTNAEVEHLSRWKAKGLNLNEYSLTPGELEDSGGEMNKFLEAACGVGIPKKGRGKRAEVKRQVKEVSLPQAEVQTLVVSQPSNVEDEVTVAKEGPIVAKRKRMEQQEAMDEVSEPVTSSLRIEKTSSTTAADLVAALREQGYIRLQTTSFYDSGMRSTAKRFINAYFPEVDRQRAKDEVAAKGLVGIAMNLVNALANEHHESLRERTQMRKDNAELIKKNEAVEAEVAKLKAEMEELRRENATLKKDSELSYQKRKIYEDELEKKEKELDVVAKAAVELKLKVNNSVEEHVEGFLKSSTFEDIVNLYRLPTAIVAFSDCRKKVKLQYPDVDVTKLTFGDQVGEVEENGESSTADFRPEVTLKWDRDSRGQTILPSKFSFKFVAVNDEGSEGANNSNQPVD
ncbi:hypothetical protein SLEP1_g48939 [Rubroshorea leprosula]|uniref:Uncharacterized protein n=1 Tax=Rubroshorea leprosula TaxID=152421 RepID=A0AAV5LYB0_9ROSI|nr:hypothetical protein SLEP1_g48939 [Rubroshorea leprosula]